MLKKSAQVLLFSAALLAAWEVQAASSDLRYHRALAQIKTGHYEEGLPTLKDLMLKNPEVKRYRYDYLAGLAWSQRDDEVLALSRTWTLNRSIPVYVLEAIGRSARNKKQYDRSLEAYDAALASDPKRVYSQIGRALTKLSMGQPQEADQLMHSFPSQSSFRQELERGFLDYYQSHPEMNDQALQFMDTLRREHPDNPSYIYQHITVLAWSGHSKEALALSKSLDRSQMPPNVLDALGRAARDTQQYSLALSYYEASVRKDTKRPDSRVGYVMTVLDEVQARRSSVPASNQAAGSSDSKELTEDQKKDQKQLKLAIVLLEPLQPLKQNRLDVKEAWLRLQDTLREDDYKILKIARNIQEKNDPKNLPAATAEIDALNRQGAPHLAMMHPMFEQVRTALKWDVRLNETGQEIRAGQIQYEAQTGEERYQKSEEALKHVMTVREGLVNSDFPEKEFYLNRLDYDRMVVLNDIRHYSEVIEIYQDLETRNVTMPSYAYVAAASAYLSTRHPAKARDVFQRALEVKPHDFPATVGLYFAYLDNGQYEEALHIANTEIPAIKSDAQATTAMAYAYTDQLKEAEVRMQKLVTATPGDYGFHKNLAQIYRFRDQPRAAEKEYTWVESAQPNDHEVQVGHTYTNMAIHDYRQAEQSLQKAESLAPREESVKKARRDWDTHNLRELDVYFGYEHGKPAGSLNGGHTNVPELGWRIYSQPIKQDWRIFNEGKVSSQRVPNVNAPVLNANGNVTFRAQDGYKTDAYYTGVGAEYSRPNNRSELSVGGTKFQNNRPITRFSTDIPSVALEDVSSDSRVRLAGANEHHFNDHWSINTSAEYNTFEQPFSPSSGGAPVRANQVGIYGNRLAIAGTWAANESRRARLGLDFSRYSDSNRRWSWFAGWSERIISGPVYKLTAALDGSIDANSLSGDQVAYYNPERQTYVGVHLNQEWVINRFYERAWKHRLNIGAGQVYQRGFGNYTVGDVRYEQIIDLSDRVNLDVAVSRDKRYYNGIPEFRNILNSSLNWRF